jgi:hypothetical protein
MKRFSETWVRRRQNKRTFVSRVDRPRQIDSIIHYFGERLAPAAVSVCGQRKA